MIARAPRIVQEPEPVLRTGQDVIDAHVVILNNYLRPHHVSVYQAVARGVRRLTVLLGTPMEPDRKWAPEWKDLDVRVQKNWTWNATWRHTAGFAVPNFIHVPIDTPALLRRLRPDVICSAEFGPRTLLAGLYRWLSPRTRLVVIGNMSTRTEQGRGLPRRLLRSLILRLGDRFTFNGKSCREYLGQIGAAAECLDYFPYFLDDQKVCRESKAFPPEGVRTVVVSGSLDERKGIRQLARALAAWRPESSRPPIAVEVCGTGPLRTELEGLSNPHVRINLVGHADDARLRSIYGRSDLCIFPSLADEWGLVPVEAMASGVPVLGSVYAQSVDDLVEDGVNGWRFRPDDAGEFLAQLSRALAADSVQLARMGAAARASVSHITPEWCARGLLGSIRACLDSRQPVLPTTHTRT